MGVAERKGRRTGEDERGSRNNLLKAARAQSLSHELRPGQKVRGGVAAKINEGEEQEKRARDEVIPVSTAGGRMLTDKVPAGK